VTDNTAGLSGGGVFNVLGSATLTDSIVSGNHAVDGFGGGIWNVAALSLVSTDLRANTAGGLGGGIFNVTGSVTVTDSTVSGNVAGDGGGIFNGGGGSVTLIGAVSVVANTPNDCVGVPAC
jgi:hypothetical protein